MAPGLASKRKTSVAFEMIRPEQAIDRMTPLGHVGYHGTSYTGAYFAASK